MCKNVQNRLCAVRYALFSQMRVFQETSIQKSKNPGVRWHDVSERGEAAFRQHTGWIATFRNFNMGEICRNMICFCLHFYRWILSYYY